MSITKEFILTLLRRLGSLLDRLGIQEDQRRPLALLSAFFFLSMAAITVTKSVQYDLFLSEVRSSWLLPALYILSALFSIPVIVWFRRLTARRSSLGLAAVTVAALAVTLLAWVPVAGRGSAGLYFAMCVWGSVFSLLLPTLGWIVSYDIFTVRESKRVFGLLGTAGILGGAAGGYLMLFLARLLSPAIFLGGVVVALAGLELILAGFYAGRGKKRDPNENVGPHLQPQPGGRLSVSSIFSSSYSQYLAILVLVSAASMTLVDLQYLSTLERRFAESPGAIAQFLGGVLGNVFLASAALQLLGAHSALRRFGVMLTAMVTPLVLFSGSAIWSVMPGFWPIVTLKILQETLKPSLHRTSLEIFYTPIPSGQRAAFRGLVELLCVRSGDAMAALLFLAAGVWPHGRVFAAVVTCLLALLWLWMAWGTGREYPTTLRLGLQLGLGGRKAAALPSEEVLTAALRSADPRKARLALEELAEVPSRAREMPAFSLAAEEPLHQHLSVVSSESAWLSLARGFLDHPDEAVRAAALKALVRHDPVTYNRLLRKQLSSDLLPDRAFLLYVAAHAARPERLIEPGQALRWCQAIGPEKASMARIMGKSRNSAYVPVLRQWLYDQDPEVAGTAIEALGQYRDERFFDLLTGFLKTPKRREAARRALASYGDEAVTRFLDPEGRFAVNRRLKREVPRILVRINSSASRAALFGLLRDADPQVSNEALKALNQTHALMDLSASPELFAPLLDSWARDCYFFQWLSLQAGQGDCSGAWRLLGRLCAERSAQAREKLFMTLEFVFPRGDAYWSSRALASHQKTLEHSALELLEARMTPDQRRKLLPALAGGLTREEIQDAAALFDLPANIAGCLRELLGGDDVVARCLALALIRQAGLTDLAPAAIACLQDADPLVRETAERYWGTA